MPLAIRPAYRELDQVRMLFHEYTSMLAVDLAFQDYDSELQNLPADYTLPRGRLYLAYFDGGLAGCIALRPFEDNCCEMKRLFVRPAFRGKKIGLALVQQVISDAREMQYDAMLLDTLPSLSASVALYKKLGFRETDPYRYNPLHGALFLRLDL